MVELHGTEKQVKWANDIRDNMIASIDTQKLDFIESHPRVDSLLDELISNISNINDSVWFIENRLLFHYYDVFNIKLYEIFGIKVKRGFLKNMIGLTMETSITGGYESALEYFNKL